VQESLDSAFAQATTPADQLPQPDPPTNLQGTPVAGGKVILKWQASPTANVSYDVYRHYVDAEPFNLMAHGVAATTYTDKNVPKGPRFYYVRAVNAKLQLSKPSNHVQVVAIP
jgi:hypothetical protein